MYEHDYDPWNGWDERLGQPGQTNNRPPPPVDAPPLAVHMVIGAGLALAVLLVACWLHSLVVA